jgi:hypothetical protein
MRHPFPWNTPVFPGLDDDPVTFRRRNKFGRPLMPDMNISRGAQEFVRSLRDMFEPRLLLPSKLVLFIGYYGNVIALFNKTQAQFSID